MVTNPEKWVNDFKNAGANQITFHIEATEGRTEVGVIIWRLLTAQGTWKHYWFIN